MEVNAEIREQTGDNAKHGSEGSIGTNHSYQLFPIYANGTSKHIVDAHMHGKNIGLSQTNQILSNGKNYCEAFTRDDNKSFHDDNSYSGLQ